MAFLALTLTACGSASSQTSSTVSLGSAVQQACTSVADVLADGPDPGADPVGYAQAQVLPLRQLTISDATLHRAVLTLASAYRDVQHQQQFDPRRIDRGGHQSRE